MKELNNRLRQWSEIQKVVPTKEAPDVTRRAGCRSYC